MAPPPRPVTTTHLCYPYNTDTHSYPMLPPPPPPKCTPPQPLFFTLLRCVFLPDDDDRVRRSRRAERGGNDNTAVIRRRRRRRWLPSAGQRFGSVHLSDVSGREGGEGGDTTTFFNFGFPSTEIKTEFLLCSRSLNSVCYFLSFCPLANAVDEPTAGQGQEKKSGGHRVPGAVPNPGRNDDDDDDVDDDRGARRGQEKF